MKHILKVFEVISDANRLRILKLLELKEFCVCELAAILGITQPSVSRHLKKLKAAGLIRSGQNGFWTDYCLSKPDDSCGKVLMSNIRSWLNDDPVVRRDRLKAGQVNRARLCCRKGI